MTSCETMRSQHYRYFPGLWWGLLANWGRDKNGNRFSDDTFKRIFLNENVRISIKISLKFVPKGPINNNPALVQIMAWRRSGDKPLSEQMMVRLPTHICVARLQWVKRFLWLILLSGFHSSLFHRRILKHFFLLCKSICYIRSILFIFHMWHHTTLIHRPLSNMKVISIGNQWLIINKKW